MADEANETWRVTYTTDGVWADALLSEERANKAAAFARDEGALNVRVEKSGQGRFRVICDTHVCPGSGLSEKEALDLAEKCKSQAHRDVVVQGTGLRSGSP